MLLEPNLRHQHGTIGYSFINIMSCKDIEIYLATCAYKCLNTETVLVNTFFHNMKTVNCSASLNKSPYHCHDLTM